MFVACLVNFCKIIEKSLYCYGNTFGSNGSLIVSMLLREAIPRNTKLKVLGLDTESYVQLTPRVAPEDSKYLRSIKTLKIVESDNIPWECDEMPDGFTDPGT